MDSGSGIINFQAVFKSFYKKRKLLILSFLFFAILGSFLYVFLPKKYTSEAEILIKKTGSTNLSFINPFVVSENSESNSMGSVFAIQNAISEEMEIIKSPLVIDSVIKDNGLKYTSGPAKGKYISTKDFLRKNFSISKIKDANIIYIAYKSKNPELSYNVVSSIITGYKKIQEEINVRKSYTDTDFLKKASIKTENELNHLIEKYKRVKKQPENAAMLQNIGMLSFYDKRLGSKLKQLSNNEVSAQKVELEIKQKTEELNSLKEKLERSSMIGQMAKGTTDIVVLQKPEIMENYNFSEPQPLVIFMMSLLGWIISCLIILSL